jgi:hypothetical protein
MGTYPKLISEFFRASLTVLQIEFLRRRRSLKVAANEARRIGASSIRRSSAERRILRTAIATVDSLLPGKPNCLRRSLMEMAMDSGAAREQLLAGFRSGGGPRSGHAWLESHRSDETYDAIFPI